jgi:hypothetical protein
VALTVTFTVCDAQQIGLSPSMESLLITGNRLAFQIKRPDQKAPQDLGPTRLVNEAYASRGQISGGSRHLDGAQAFQYMLAAPISWASPFCQRLNSCESPRAPPLMDPPTFC